MWFLRVLRVKTLKYPRLSKKNLSTSAACYRKVALIGATGGIGQPLSLQLKLSSLITNLSLYDNYNVEGVAVDLSHIDTKSKVQGCNTCGEAVTAADVIIICAGRPRIPGMTRDELFSANAGIISNLLRPIINTAPKALIAIITHPVNSIIPFAAEILRNEGVFDSRKLFGITTVDVIRAKLFLANLKKLSLKTSDVPVIGGQSGSTTIPLFSQSSPQVDLSKEEIETLTKQIQGADDVVAGKKGHCAATLSMANAAARFTFSLIRGLNGESGIVECAYVESNILECAPFFSNPVLLGHEGIEENLGFGKLSEYEENLLKAGLLDLHNDIKKGVDYAMKEIQSG